MVRVCLATVCLASLGLILAAVAQAGQPEAAGDHPGAKVTIVTLGDSITKGVRSGVDSEETFAYVVAHLLDESGLPVRTINVGVGGERADQALVRLDEVIAQRPRHVTVMYGTNDSYVDRGEQESRLPLAQFRTDLREIVARLLMAGIEPVLMTEPRWAPDTTNGLDENPNARLEPYLDAVRELARECGLPLVDHYQHWTKAEQGGQQLRDWTTDGLHPNPRGHREMAETMLPVLSEMLRSDPPRVGFRVELDTLLEHDDGKFLWFHPRVAALPGFGKDGDPAVLMTLQKHLHTSDHYSGTSVMRSDDLGRTWSAPEARAELDWVREPNGVHTAVADVTPGWHAKTGKLIAVGAQVRYSPAGKQVEDRPRSQQTAYAVFDPVARSWTKWRRLEMPEDERFNFARCACAQFVVEPDGTVLLPCYIGPSQGKPYSVTVVRCAFDGSRLSYLEHGDVLSLDAARGLYEPSLVRLGERYYLTIRNDLKGYVTASDDPLRYRPVKPWTFDDGTELGSYNTQQHWLTHGDALFLAYTRRGADNDHVFRHRAPLFMAQVDPRRLVVLRDTERVLVPERGATLGNFGAAAIDQSQSWVTVAEGVFNDESRRRGATGATYVARVIWSDDQQAAASRRPTEHSAAQPQYAWTQVTDQAAYAPRDGAGALTFGDRMWLLGGWNPSDKKHFPRVCNNEVWSSSDGAQWRLNKPNTFLDASFDPASDWEGRHTAGYVVHDGRMWIVGGDANQGHYQNDVWNSHDGRSWQRVADQVPWAPRALHYTLAFDGKIWVIGGQTMPGFAGGDETFYRDVWNSTDGAKWTRIVPREPCWSPRGMIGGSAVFNGRMWILGGGTYDTPTTPKRNFYNDVWSSSDGVRWTRHVEHAPWYPRQYHEVAVFDDKLWVLEGYHADGGNRNDVWYSADGTHWQELPGTPWKVRHAASVFVFDDALWMVAGNNMQRDVWKLERAR